MESEWKKTLLQHTEKLISIFVISVMLLCSLSIPVFAKSEKIKKNEVEGKLYEFDKDSHYEFNETNSYRSTELPITYGTFSVSGNVEVNKTKGGILTYKVKDGDFVFYYDYKDTKLNAGDEQWHLVNDKSNKVADFKLGADIMKGAIIIQTYSKDNKWVTVKTFNNAFSDVPNRKEPIYTVSNMQLINGCNFRVIVVYEFAKKDKDKNLLVFDKYNFKKYAEVYRLYAYTGDETAKSEDSKADDLNQTYSLGETVKVKEFDGYYGETSIEKGDMHYGWDLGNFFVSGYTDKVKGADENMVFLKNVGDKVTLWFNLEQDINCLNGDDKLSIAADEEGYDQYFQTPRMDFGRGMLIIRETDYTNVKGKPIPHKNYLEANTSTKADTKVQLFEEGDYEVALDYAVKKDELIDKTGHYRIFFKFSVRNGNCMVYPFDVKTGSELTNSSMTENGFRLDLAKSRYLKINLKREVLTDSADGLVEDTRFNGPAKDGAEYTDKGIYTITVSNEYTGASTTKKIYVGKNNILRAYVTTGYSISEINRMVANGAKISNDGTIQLASASSGNSDGNTAAPSASSSSNQSSGSGASNNSVMITGIIACATVAVVWIKKKK